mmetsp:Transcript_124821/g.361062  ORF Transcript_124821/g.361062 Transcript_124821/m.361062 type:complete len:267 (+) Transcript_124821:39-839(+)
MARRSLGLAERRRRVSAQEAVHGRRAGSGEYAERCGQPHSAAARFSVGAAPGTRALGPACIRGPRLYSTAPPRRRRLVGLCGRALLFTAQRRRGSSEASLAIIPVRGVAARPPCSAPARSRRRTLGQASHTSSSAPTHRGSTMSRPLAPDISPASAHPGTHGVHSSDSRGISGQSSGSADMPWERSSQLAAVAQEAKLPMRGTSLSSELQREALRVRAPLRPGPVGSGRLWRHAAGHSAGGSGWSSAPAIERARPAQLRNSPSTLS